MTGADYAIVAYVIAFSLMLLYGLGIWRQRRRLRQQPGGWRRSCRSGRPR